jgi:hypothetical protein
VRYALLLLIPLVVQAAGPEERAIAYLGQEVPRWSRENRCFSCHNNGDGARALYAARRLAYQVPEDLLADTTRWLIRPLEWDTSPGDPRFSDKKLARIQFAASLVEAFDAGLVRERKLLVQAAESLLPHQDQDGCWRVDAEAAAGSPVTYGPALATYMARRALEKAGEARFAGPIARADRWLLAAPMSSMLDAAVAILALDAATKRQRALEMIARGPASEGGWGPFANSPPEPFDTAVVLLALASVEQRPQVRALIERGRGYLVRAQLPEGGWPETTRPAGARSYAQHMSTSGWATLALLSTTEPR